MICKQILKKLVPDSVNYSTTIAKKEKNGPAISHKEDAATLAAITKDLSISNLTLYTAIEQNPVIVQALVEKFRSGNLSYNIPFVHMNTVSGLSASGTNNVSVRYSRPHGSRLKKILYSGFEGTNNELYNNNNLAAIKFDDYYTMINNVRTTQFDYNTGAGIEWLVQKDNLVGSALMSSNEYFYNFSHVGWIWCGCNSGYRWPSRETGKIWLCRRRRVFNV
mgnify:CR=1 FL=1